MGQSSLIICPIIFSQSNNGNYKLNAINSKGEKMKKLILLAYLVMSPFIFSQIRAHWTFTETSGSSLLDQSGNGKHGQIYGATWQQTNGLRGLSFNGVNNYISVPHNSIFNFGTGDFTLEVQFKTSVIPTYSWSAIFSKHNTANWHDKEIFLGIAGNTGLPFISLSDGNGYFETAYGLSNVCDGVFHTVRGVRQGNQLRLYVDGKLQQIVSASINPDSNNPINIGRSSYNNGQGYFNGIICNISLWNTGTIITSYYNKIAELPSEFALKQNYPNPFNPTTTIQYQIPERCFVSLRIVDALGKEIGELVNEDKNPGSYVVRFNGSNLSSGVYFYQIRAGSFVETKKLLLTK